MGGTMRDELGNAVFTARRQSLDRLQVTNEDRSAQVSAEETIVALYTLASCCAEIAYQLKCISGQMPTIGKGN